MSRKQTTVRIKIPNLAKVHQCIPNQKVNNTSIPQIKKEDKENDDGYGAPLNLY